MYHAWGHISSYISLSRRMSSIDCWKFAFVWLLSKACWQDSVLLKHLCAEKSSRWIWSEKHKWQIAIKRPDTNHKLLWKDRRQITDSFNFKDNPVNICVDSTSGTLMSSRSTFDEETNYISKDTINNITKETNQLQKQDILLPSKTAVRNFSLPPSVFVTRLPQNCPQKFSANKDLQKLN